jgi:SAM-dependent methyltransferase
VIEPDANERATGQDFYGPQYARMDGELAAEIRREAFGEDIGQESWRSAAEQAEIAAWLELGTGRRVLDVACGAGGPSLALVKHFGCRLTGLDIVAEGIEHASDSAGKRGLAHLADFAVADCGARLPFEDGGFDAILCIDSISHLPNRQTVFAEWRRLLKPGGRLVFTDPAVVTGPLAKSEIDDRTAVTANVYFVPQAFNEDAIRAAGLNLIVVHDRTEAVACIASRWGAARERYAEAVRRQEGEDWFARRQRMLAAAAELARTRRLSRFIYLAEKPPT